MDNLDHQDPFFDFWFNRLSQSQRKARMESAFSPIKKVARKQIALLERHEKSLAVKEVGFSYFINTVKNTWENIDFAIELGKGRHRLFSYYPTRNVLESLLRLEHYCRQDTQGQNDIAVRELLRIAKRFYERERTEGGTGDSWREQYDDIARNGTYPPIEEANTREPFPRMDELAERSSFSTSGSLYASYQALCELSHGKLLSTIYSRMDEKREHLRSMMLLMAFSLNLLKVTDAHMGRTTTAEVTEAIRASEAIVKKGLQS